MRRSPSANVAARTKDDLAGQRAERGIDRRDLLSGAVASLAALSCTSLSNALDARTPEPKLVAGVITAYQKGLHADVLLGKILEGWHQDLGAGPALKLASLYVDQFPDQDLARPLAEKYNIPIFDTIEKAITIGRDHIPVSGVISIGEHGNYPTNERGQHLYPRRRFFEAITDTFLKYGTVVPVFNDKHLGPVWDDAKWMYDRARMLRVPFLAGSSLPLSFRTPEISVPMGAEIEAAVGIGYSGLDIYGSHSLECFQCLLERRVGGEKGVKWVQCLQGDAIWQALDGGRIDRDLLAAAIAVVPHSPTPNYRQAPNATLFMFQYVDGLLGSVLMLPEFAGGISVGLRIKGQAKPLATRFEERPQPYYPHFAYLLKAIERMIHTGRASYPVERTLLTSGILDRALVSLSQGQKRLDTPELEIAYRPADYPHAPRPDLTSDPRNN